MKQDNEKLSDEHYVEVEIFDINADEALCVAGGPEVENEPTR
ncbi:MAG TPA: hypothetical protein VGD52_03765 [Pseudoduganella sp.]